MFDATAEETIILRDDIDVRDLSQSLFKALGEMGRIRSSSLDETNNGYVIKAKTEPTLRTWGEEIKIEITSDKMMISSESPDQLLDWGRSGETVNKISKWTQKQIGNEGIRPV